MARAGSFSDSKHRPRLCKWIRVVWRELDGAREGLCRLEWLLLERQRESGYVVQFRIIVEIFAALADDLEGFVVFVQFEQQMAKYAVGVGLLIEAQGFLQRGDSRLHEAFAVQGDAILHIETRGGRTERLRTDAWPRAGCPAPFAFRRSRWCKAQFQQAVSVLWRERDRLADLLDGVLQVAETAQAQPLKEEHFGRHVRRGLLRTSASSLRQASMSPSS